jgi:hypothetical protein
MSEFRRSCFATLRLVHTLRFARVRIDTAYDRPSANGPVGHFVEKSDAF